MSVNKELETLLTQLRLPTFREHYSIYMMRMQVYF